MGQSDLCKRQTHRQTTIDEGVAIWWVAYADKSRKNERESLESHNKQREIYISVIDERFRNENIKHTREVTQNSTDTRQSNVTEIIQTGSVNNECYKVEELTKT